MTLREMSVEYRAQAQALRGRMQELEKAWKQTGGPGGAGQFGGKNLDAGGSLAGDPGSGGFAGALL